MEYKRYTTIRNGLIVKINGVNNKCFIKTNPGETSAKKGIASERIPEERKIIAASNYKAIYAASVGQNRAASEIKNAVFLGENEDMPIRTKNGGFLIDKATGSSLFYGKNAVKFLRKNLHYDFDTQVIFPKGASGSLVTSSGKTINLPENSAVMINADSDVKIVPDASKGGYPVIVTEKHDYEWYDRYGAADASEAVAKKYNEIAELNTHYFNGAFSTDFLLPESLKDSSIWNSKTGIGESWKAKGKMLSVLNENRESLPEEKVKELDKVNDFVAKLFKNNVLEYEDNGYVKFRFNFKEPYQSAFLKEHGLSEEETKILMPMCELMRTAKQNSRPGRKDKAEAYPKESIPKLKEAGLIFDAKKDDGFIYWKEPTDNLKLLEQQLIEADIPKPERAAIIKAYESERKSGFDYSGHQYSDSDIAVYKLDEKVNNWSLEETNHVTNATAPSSDDGKTQSIGVSIVQYGKERIADASEIRKGEQLHSHPNTESARQSEVYLITRGSAALGIMQDGKLQTKVLNAGDLAVIEPGVPHFVTAVRGEYEHVVTQVPSTFQYGFGFKQCIEADEASLEEQRLDAHEKLGEYDRNRESGIEIYKGPESLPDAASNI